MAVERRTRTTRRGEAAVPDAVCDATEKLLGEQPFEKLTVSQILARSDVSRTSFYYWFPSKDAVLAALLDRIAQQLDASLAGPGDDVPGTEEWIRTALEAAFRIWDEHAAVLRIAQEAARSATELGATWRALVETRYVRPYAERLRREQAIGLLSPAGDPLVLSRSLHWMAEQALYGHVTGRDRTAPATVAEALAHVWATALRPAG